MSLTVDDAGSLPRERPRRAARWPAVGLALRILLSAGFMAAAFASTPQSLDLRHLAALGPVTVLNCLLLSAAMLLLLAWRWRWVAAAVHSGPSPLPGLASFARMTWTGLAINQLLPSTLGGDALRVSELTRQKLAVSKAMGSVVIDRAYGMMALALLCLAGAPALHPILPDAAAFLAGATALAVTIAAAVILLRGRMASRFGGVGAVLCQVSSPRAILLLIPAALLSHLLNVLVFLLIAHALGVDFPPLAAAAVMAGVLFMSALPLSVAGWGLREFSLLQAFGQIGVDNNAVLTASVVYGLFILVTQSLGFLLLIGRART